MLTLGLLLSVLLHILVLLVSRQFIDVGPPSTQPAGETRVGEPEPEGMRAVRLALTPEAEPPVEAEAPVVDEPEPQPVREPAPEPQPPVEGEADAGEARSAADRLRPRMTDRRVWALPDEIDSPELSDEERLRLRLYGRLDAFNDSMAAADAARRRSLDWTVEGEDGKRWGISTEGIHLGDITLPAPSFLSPSPAARARMREWGEIQQQADRARLRQRFDERVEALRKRKEAERRKQKEKDGSGSSGSSPDG